MVWPLRPRQYAHCNCLTLERVGAQVAGYRRRQDELGKAVVRAERVHTARVCTADQGGSRTVGEDRKGGRLQTDGLGLAPPMPTLPATRREVAADGSRK